MVSKLTKCWDEKKDLRDLGNNLQVQITLREHEKIGHDSRLQNVSSFSWLTRHGHVSVA